MTLKSIYINQLRSFDEEDFSDDKFAQEKLNFKEKLEKVSQIKSDVNLLELVAIDIELNMLVNCGKKPLDDEFLEYYSTLIQDQQYPPVLFAKNPIELDYDQISFYEKIQISIFLISLKLLLKKKPKEIRITIIKRSNKL